MTVTRGLPNRHDVSPSPNRCRSQHKNHLLCDIHVIQFKTDAMMNRVPSAKAHLDGSKKMSETKQDFLRERSSFVASFWLSASSLKQKKEHHRSDVL